MATIIAQLMVVMLIANSFIYAGLAFINGRLLPSAFGGFYGLIPSHNWRLLIAMLTWFLLANLLFAWGYRHAPASLAGTVHIATGVVVMVVSAMLLDGTRMTSLSFIGVSLMVLGGIFVVQGLQPVISATPIK